MRKKNRLHSISLFALARHLKYATHFSPLFLFVILLLLIERNRERERMGEWESPEPNIMVYPHNFERAYATLSIKHYGVHSSFIRFSIRVVWKPSNFCTTIEFNSILFFCKRKISKLTTRNLFSSFWKILIFPALFSLKFFRTSLKIVSVHTGVYANDVRTTFVTEWNTQHTHTFIFDYIYFKWYYAEWEPKQKQQ